MPAYSADILELDTKRRTAQTAAQEMLAKRNQLSKEIGQAKAKKEDAAPLMAEVARLRTRAHSILQRVSVDGLTAVRLRADVAEMREPVWAPFPKQ